MVLLLFALSIFGFYVNSRVVRCGPCPLDFVAYKKLGCFYFRGFSAETMTRDRAKVACFAMRGSNLASIDDAEQESWLANDFMVKNETISWTSWIGLVRRDERRDEWRWEDNSTSAYTHWAPGEPNDSQGLEACTMIRLKQLPNGTYYILWNDAVCEPTSRTTRMHSKASGYFCRLPYKEEPVSDGGGVNVGDQRTQQDHDQTVFGTNVGLAVSVVVLLAVVLSVVGYVVWINRRRILSKFRATETGSSDNLKFDHE